MKITLLQLARYNQWANKTLVNEVMSKTPALVDKEISSSFNTIRKTFMHIADAEYIWFCRLNHMPFDKLPGKVGLGIESLAEQDKKIIEFIESKEDTYFKKVLNTKL